MSIRKGGPHKTERKNVKVDADAHAELLKYAQSKGIGMRLILSEFIFKGVEFDISEDDWIEKLKAKMRITTGYAAMGDCEGLAFGKNKDLEGIYTCVWYREGRPPQIRVLGKSEELQRSRCAACGRTEEIAKEFKERDRRIVELEVELGSKSSERLKIPKCNRGAVLNHDKEDRLIFTNCFRNRGIPVSVKNFCRIQANGLPCMFFAELTVGVGAKKT